MNKNSSESRQEHRADSSSESLKTSELDASPSFTPFGLVHVITAHNGIGEQKECIVTSSLPLAVTIRDALKGVWIGGNVAVSSRTIDEIPRNVLAEIDVMENPAKPTGWIGGGRHG